MGAYKSAVITEAGQGLIAKALAEGESIQFVSAKTSSHAYPEGTNIAELTDLRDIMQSVSPFSAQVFNETMMQVSVRFDNSEVPQKYLTETIGLYAQSSSTEPVLFSVIQAITPDEMPEKSEVSPSAYIYNIQMTVQQASKISVTVNPAGTATIQDILALEEKKVNSSGGDVSKTVSSVTEPTGTEKYPTIGKGSMEGVLGNIKRWLLSLKAWIERVAGTKLTGITLSVSGWSAQNEYIIEHEKIEPETVCDVFFAQDSMEAAVKAGISGRTEAGKMILYAVKKPLIDITIETIWIHNYDKR